MICEACGSVVNSSLATCPICGHQIGEPPPAIAPREPETATAEPVVSASADAPIATGTEWPSPVAGSPETPVALGPYRSAIGLTRLVRIYLTAWAALMGIFVAHTAGAARLLQRLADDPATVRGSDILAVLDRTRMLGWVGMAAGIVFGVLMAAWTYRVYGNIAAIGGRRGRYTRKWAIWGWFIPFLNFVRPKQIVDDLWRTSDPDRPAEPDLTWMGTRVAGFVHLWWAMQITSVVTTIIFLGVDSLDPASAARSLKVLTFGYVIQGVFAVLDFWVVSRITSRQAHRAVAVYDLAGAVEPDWATSVVARGSGGGLRMSNVVLIPVIVALAGTAAWYSFEGSLEGPDASLAGRDTIGALDLGVGDCFDLPPDLTLVVALPRADCAGPHDFEVFHLVHHASSPSAAYPGQETLFEAGVAECGGDAFEEFVGAAYGDSSLDVLVLSPSDLGWSAGDRTSTCSLYRLDGTQMVGTAEGSGW